MRKSTPKSQVSRTTVTEYDSGENIRVCVRSRPMNKKELAQGDSPCVNVVDSQNMQLSIKSSTKSYRFHQVMGESYTQGQMFSDSGVHVLIDSVLEGYSASVFAYGQTGSGKTYTMAGAEEKLGRQDYVSDETDGLIPRSISYLWQSMAERQEQYYVKAAFMEIYNEQVRDLLNPSSGVLHCRWNIKSGFFVEDLLIVDCTNIDDLIAVLHEGIGNRKTGSHELNSDSSRSHSILLVYVISEIRAEDGHAFKKFGKMCFVDLAGSERLKESKSKGTMVKETGNINRSLFTLGKVIVALADKKRTKSHIPYRDSKLTMLLMDSLGGVSKALMIACVSPASSYSEETLSTLNYAARTMNIKNKPIIQMDNKEQVVFNLKREIQLLKMENEYLKEQITRVNGGMPPMMVEVARNRQTSAKSQNGKLPPIQRQEGQSSQQILQEYHTEISRLREENTQLNNGREVFEKLSRNVVGENQTLHSKLQNLESVFADISSSIESSPEKTQNQYTITNLLNENSNMKRQITKMEQEKAELRSKLLEAPAPTETTDIYHLNQNNTQLQKRIEFLQKREKDLLEHLIKAQRDQYDKK